MAPLLPLELIIMILKVAIIELFRQRDVPDPLDCDYSESCSRKQEIVNEAFSLLRICRSVRATLEPVLYRSIREPPMHKRLGGYRSYTLWIQLLCRTMITRPSLAAQVHAITINSYSFQRELGETEGNDEDFSWHDLLAAETERLERKFRASEEYAVALEKNNLDALKRPSVFAWKWVLLFQLTNLKALSMNHGTPAPANMLILVRLPLLEKLALRVEESYQRSCFNVQLSPAVSRVAAPVPVQPLDILESVLSSTRCLKSLKFWHVVGCSAEPIQQDAARLKRILDPHAHTLQYLNIRVSNSLNDDDEYPGHYSNVKGSLGCLQHFTKLNRLVIQLELLLGKPRDNIRLRDVLSSQLRSFVCFNLNNERGKRLWKGRNYVPQFQEIAEDAADGRFPQLTSVEMCLDKDQSRDGDPQDLRGGAFHGSRPSFEIVRPLSDWDGQQEFNEMRVLAEQAYENEPLAD
ncbi:hypothetical protein ASPCAL11698 [Aspergillus calidoustus]|uniref:F-box domain-containing protein n=1 Tax=Aspergillus calidoustus TaxID=454130 RepID=A0A0U4ZFR2_ASPCI|nr:hypothetical protein ASPCAL11698 [Aspergillus calidoustus]